jgi:uncharacterized membrane protein YqaE (UPF0057 family)
MLCLAAILLLASCSNKFSLVKRKYNKGYYIATNKKMNTPDGVKDAGKQSSLTQEVVAKVSNSSVDQTVPDNFIKTNEDQINILPVTITGNKTLKKTNAPKLQTSANPEVVVRQNTIRDVPDEDKTRSEQKATDSDVNMVLLVILAIFIPPLAVYLKHRTIDKWFWITLILSLLGWGFFMFSAFGGLFGLAAIVIAILYVLDMIN